ncbi:MAG TPA: PP2C family protein-serine/threonine phosphatase [Spirochaetota bacterium]|nr:PP2C family protein-serine/threonine phosphatase [Spirochaetota bacterium]HPS86443.1 PP2C family protein-serine/threonine phosphatase [Spirochaetota bacterium]
MEYLTERFSIYIIPPLLSIGLGWSLAAVSIIKGRYRTENILFSLVCIWWTLMPLVFLSHHLFKGNIELIMTIERTFHFLYVYMPAIILLYLQKSFALNKKNLVIASFVLSILISVFVPTKYYISGLYTYSWGYSAKGEIVFKIFGTCAFMHLVYVIWFFKEKVRNVKNYTERLKLKYILLSFIASAVLMIFNVPAINGIDIYAYGNFMFIPLALIAYGVLRYRLMDIKSVLHLSLIWAVLSSLILVPNIFIFIFIKPHLNEMNNAASFLFLVAWFLINYFYFKRIKPVIDRLFNKQKTNLIRAGIDFADSISFLKTIDSLIELFTSVLAANLYFKNIEFYIRMDDGPVFKNQKGDIYEMNRDLYDWFVDDDSYVELDMMNTNPYYSPIIEKMSGIFKELNCSYIFPLARNNEMVGIAFSGERMNLRNLNRDESVFLESVKRSMSISISNSVMYQNLNNLKNNLESKVASRTEELLLAMEGVEAANLDLTAANNELNETRRIAEIDMLMAANVQKSIFPEIPAAISGWDIAAAFMPMSMVSGDLYDFYLEEDNLKGMILLDVSGHGISSGLITMIARSVFYRNFFAHKDMRLGRIVENANNELIGEIGNTDKFLTGIMLRFEDDCIEYVNAGHPDMMLRKNDSDQVRIINPSDKNFKGSILGVSEMSFSYKSAKFKAESGDIFVIFSDGIIEAVSPDSSRFGIIGIAKAMIKSNNENAEETLNRIIKDFYDFTGTDKLTDDVTVIIIKRK